LTEVVHDVDARRAVEMHLCMHHAVEAGLVMPGAEMLPQITAGWSQKSVKTSPTIIVPTSSTQASSLTITRGSSQTSAAPATCPLCGTTWTQFRHTGLMGCPHDYEMFERKLLPLLKRAQEGAGEHIGKISSRKKSQETDRQVTSLRLKRELQKAVDSENYEKAARLRDELRTIEATA